METIGKPEKKQNKATLNEAPTPHRGDRFRSPSSSGSISDSAQHTGGYIEWFRPDGWWWLSGAFYGEADPYWDYPGYMKPVDGRWC